MDTAPANVCVMLVPAAAAAAAATAAAARGRQGDAGFQNEAHIRQINFNGLNLIEQCAFDAESKAAFLKGLILFVRLIQSQCQPGAASAAGSQIDANAATFLALKVRFKLFAGAVG